MAQENCKSSGRYRIHHEHHHKEDLKIIIEDSWNESNEDDHEEACLMAVRYHKVEFNRISLTRFRSCTSRSHYWSVSKQTTRSDDFRNSRSLLKKYSAATVRRPGRPFKGRGLVKSKGQRSPSGLFYSSFSVNALKHSSILHSSSMRLVHVPFNSSSIRLAMSSDNTLFAVTYTSISSDLNGLSWGIPLVNADELLEMDPYEEVAQQGQTLPLSPACVPDPMKLDEHVPVYVLEPEHPEYHVPTYDDIQSMENDSIDYPDEPEDDDEDLEEDPEEDYTNYPADGEDGDDEPSDDDDNDDDTNDENEEHLALADSSIVPVVDHVPSVGDTEASETDESAPTPRSPQTRVPFSQTRLRRAQKIVRLDPPMSASMEARIAEHAVAPIPPTSPAYDHAPLGHKTATTCMRDDILEKDMPPRRRFILTAPPPGYDVAESSAVATARPPRGQYDFVDTIEVRALQASKHRMMTSIEEVNLRVIYQAQVRRQESEDFYTQLHNAQTDRGDIRLEIDVVRDKRTTYETELHEVRQAYLSSEAQNRALLARLETLETHMSRMEWQRQRAEDHAVRQMMRTQVLEARAQIDTVEDTGSSC
ncbi:hypothetical protein Tco_0707591 [Tanacetum coccineum]|uniref:Uncharacterized protein n=1 Tax=Tanacetum coccineum TaxID=301880 RepID=A0ABQ4YBG7_9ASTR